jgi:hypothetical protein
MKSQLIAHTLGVFGTVVAVTVTTLVVAVLVERILSS